MNAGLGYRIRRGVHISSDNILGSDKLITRCYTGDTQRTAVIKWVDVHSLIKRITKRGGMSVLTFWARTNLSPGVILWGGGDTQRTAVINWVVVYNLIKRITKRGGMPACLFRLVLHVQITLPPCVSLPRSL